MKSNFSFSHNVFKSCLLLMRQNEYLWSRGLMTLRNKVFENIVTLEKKADIGIFCLLSSIY